jgi:hypothetical protein
MDLPVRQGARRNPFRDEAEQLVAKGVGRVRVKEGLGDELAIGKRAAGVNDQVDLFPGGLPVEADGPVPGVAHGGHRQVLLVARGAVLSADVPEERLARPGRGRLQRRHRLLGRSDHRRILELFRKRAVRRVDPLGPRLVLGAGGDERVDDRRPAAPLGDQPRGLRHQPQSAHGLAARRIRIGAASQQQLDQVGAERLVPRRPVQGREVRHRVPGVDVRPAVDQQVSRLEAVVPAGLRQRVAEISRPVRIGPALEQEANHPHVVVIGGPHQRRTKARREIIGSRIIRLWELIGLRAGVQQQPHRLQIAARRSRDNGTDAGVVVLRGVGAALEEQFDGPRIAGAAGGQDQRRVAEVGPHPDLRAGVHEQAGLFVVRRGTDQGRDVGLVRRVRVGAPFEQDRDAPRTRVERRQDQRRVALRVAGVHVRAVVEHLADGSRVRIPDGPDQDGRDRTSLGPVAGANRSRRER